MADTPVQSPRCNRSPLSRALGRRLLPPVSVAHFHSLLASSGACLCAMTNRKGHRCLPMALPDRSISLQEGLVWGKKRARVVADDRKVEVNQTSPEPFAACAAADTSRGSQDQLLDPEKSMSSAGTEQLEVDRGEARFSSDEESGKRPPVECRISISSIIRAGSASARNNSPSAAPSAQSVVISDTAVVQKGAEGCSSCVATKSMDDEPSALSQSLKRVCWAAASTGLTAKEAVGKIRELCLPGLNEGDERLIVQVAKAFRSSSAFMEGEERGRYVVQGSPSPKMEWGNLDTGESKVSREKGSSDDTGSAILEAVEAARQLQSLRRMQHEGVAVWVGSACGGAEKNRGRAAVTAVRSKSGTSASSSRKVSASLAYDEPRCNREDGKGWRCFLPSQAGFSTLCKHHQDQMRRRSARRRRRLRNKSNVQSSVASTVKASNPRRKVVEKGAGFREGAEGAEGNWMESDEGEPDRKRRRFVKAKSLKSIM